MNKRLFKDFCVFSKYQLESKDIDPVYPVLRRYYRLRGLTGEQKLWFTELYVTFYDLGSAQKVFDKYLCMAEIEDPLTYSTGIERRGFRGNGLATEHLNSFVAAVRRYGKILSWVKSGMNSSSREESWRKMRDSYQHLRYCGPWSSYKWADLLKNVHGFKLTANDIGVGGNSETAGPIPGMVLLTEENWKRCATDVALQKDLLSRSVDAGVAFSGLDQLETCLCDFNSLVKGSYYSGHDIDIQQVQLPDDPVWQEARAAEIPAQTRGEIGGWIGVRKKLKALYRDKGEIYSDLR